MGGQNREAPKADAREAQKRLDLSDNDLITGKPPKLVGEYLEFMSTTVDPKKGGTTMVRPGEGYIKAIERMEPGLSDTQLQVLSNEAEKVNGKKSRQLQPGDFIVIPPLKT
jgi:hypothetical protein